MDAAETAVSSGEDQLVVTAENGDIAAYLPYSDGALTYDPEQNFWVQVWE
jgi:hypothetical protein